MTIAKLLNVKLKNVSSGALRNKNGVIVVKSSSGKKTINVVNGYEPRLGATPAVEGVRLITVVDGKRVKQSKMLYISTVNGRISNAYERGREYVKHDDFNARMLAYCTEHDEFIRKIHTVICGQFQNGVSVANCLFENASSVIKKELGLDRSRGSRRYLSANVDGIAENMISHNILGEKRHGK